MFYKIRLVILFNYYNYMNNLLNFENVSFLSYEKNDEAGIQVRNLKLLSLP